MSTPITNQIANLSIDIANIAIYNFGCKQNLCWSTNPNLITNSKKGLLIGA